MKLAAEELDLPVYQPESLRSPAAAGPLVDARPDLLVVVAYGEILRRHVLELAPYGAINVHPSLLPRYRGSAPVRGAILKGDDQTGVSIIKLVRRLDAGPILRQVALEIDSGEDAAQLESRLAALAADILPETCIEWITGAIELAEQDDSKATMTREWSRDDARIDWDRSADDIARLVRASQPWPVAWTNLDGRPFRIHRASPGEHPAALPPGLVRRVGRRIIVGCGEGELELVDVQPAGKRAMPAMGWWNGVRADEVQFEA